MAHLDDNSVLDKGTSFCVGSWIFVADGSGSFESRPIEPNAPETSEAAKCHEIDDFIVWLKEIGLPASNSETRIQPEFGAIKPKTLSELEEDLDRLLEDTKTTMDEKIPSYTCIHFTKTSFWKNKSKTRFKKTTHRKKPSEDIFSNIDNIDEKIEHCLQLAEDTFNDGISYKELSNPWALNSAELEQDQAFIKFLKELDEPISEDELAECGQMTSTYLWKD